MLIENFVKVAGGTMRCMFYETNHRHSTSVFHFSVSLSSPSPFSLSLSSSGSNSGRKLHEQIPLESAGMVKLRNFSSRSDVSNHSGERRAAFTRILLCCLDTYISRLIVGAWPKKGKITVTNKFCPICFTLSVLDSTDVFSSN